MVKMDPVKVAGVTDWPILTSKKEVQSFLSFVNFYRWFFQDFSHHARLLFDLTKQDMKWTCGKAEQSAFDLLNKSPSPQLQS